MPRQRSATRHPIAKVVLKPRGYQACLGIRVELTCGHQVVIAPGARLDRPQDCYRCEALTAARKVLTEYLARFPR